MHFLGSENFPVCLGPKKCPATPEETIYSCILCQEEETLTPTGKAMGMASFIQKSTVLSKRRFNESGNDYPPVTAQYSACPILAADLFAAPYTSSCGHVMHSTCWANLVRDKREYLCPLCR